ncbi:MAG: metallophosphoesterase [Gemmatimonadaceae bacterium]|nr:metallophosphoesterase [Gemmatimonadaceae bacterium]
MKRRDFLLTAGASLAGLGSYAHWVEPFWLDVTRRDLPIAHLPQSLDGKTLLQLSDLHIGPVKDSYLERVWLTGRALSPDIVVYTGDWLTWRGPEQLAQLEHHLPLIPHGRMATVSILGNHDYGYRWRDRTVADAIVSRIEAVGVPVLRNAAMEIDGLSVVGIDDWWSPYAKPEVALANWTRDTPTLVLNHNPDCMDDRARWHGYDGWVLSGHTHGGQCRSPFLDPPLIPVRNKRYTSGEIALDDGRRVYISRAVGFNVQVRLGVRPEIVLFTLRRA